jgi:predicted amidophosphoribosyltransferase
MPLKLSEQPQVKPSFLLAVSYRVALPVTQICEFTNGDYYPVCPRCTSTLDREYMAYCDRCGQHLNWQWIDFAQIISPPLTDLTRR